MHRLELGRVDDRWHGHFDDFCFRLALARLPELRIEPVAADVGCARQDLVDEPDVKPESPGSAHVALTFQKIGAQSTSRSRAAVLRTAEISSRDRY